MARQKRSIQEYIYITISLLAGAFLGLSIAMLFFGGIVMPEQYSALPGWANLLIFLSVYFLAVAAHETGHFIGFVINGIEMRALFITSFLFIKDSGRWKLKFRPNNITLLGGIAIPDLKTVKDREDFERQRKAYAQAILAGPIASVLLCLMILLLSVPLILLLHDRYVLSAFFIASLSITVITIFLLVTCIVKTETVIGDFPAYRLCRDNPSFVAMQLYQYAIFSSDPDRVRRENIYLKDLILDDLKRKHQKRDFSIFTLNAVDIFLAEYLVGITGELPDVTEEFIRSLLLSPVVRGKISASEVGTILWFHIVRLLNQREETRESALEEYQFLAENINLKNPVNQYLKKQAEHFLGLADHSAFLRDKRNIRVSSVHGIWKNFEGYYVDELRLNKMDPK
jgi:hypothetical protein